RLTVSSNQIFLGRKVEIPFSLSSIFLIGYFDTVFPREFLPLMASEAKSTSNFSFLTLPTWRSKIVITWVSPFGVAEKDKICDPGFSCVKSYDLSRVIPETLNRLMNDGPDFPSRYTIL